MEPAKPAFALRGDDGTTHYIELELDECQRFWLASQLLMAARGEQSVVIVNEPGDVPLVDIRLAENSQDQITLKLEGEVLVVSGGSSGVGYLASAMMWLDHPDQATGYHVHVGYLGNEMPVGYDSYELIIGKKE